MKRNRQGKQRARCKILEMAVGSEKRVIEVAKEIMGQIDQLDELERLVVVAYLQVFKRGAILADKTQIFEFYIDSHRAVIAADLYLLHKRLCSAVSKCCKPRNFSLLQIREEICVALFCEKIVLFGHQLNPNKKRRK